MSTPTPKRYTKNSDTVRSLQWDNRFVMPTHILMWAKEHGQFAQYIREGERHPSRGNYPGEFIMIETRSGDSKMELGDYLVEDLGGDLYPVNERIFEESHTLKETEPGSMYPFAVPEDREIANRLDELGKTPECECNYRILRGKGEIRVSLMYEFRCPVHYPETLLRIK